MELVMLEMENLGILSSKQIQTLLSLSIEMLRGFSQVQQQDTSSLQSLMKVFGLLEGTTIIKEGLLEMSQKIRESDFTMIWPQMKLSRLLVDPATH